MDTMNIALPEALKAFVQDQVARGGYSSASEYIRELIRVDQKAKAKQALEEEILVGIRSGEGLRLSGDDWQAIRDEVKRRHRSRTDDQQIERG